MQRIGVFVCWCGSNIAATVDVERVSQALSKEPGVVFSTNYQYMCSENGQQLIKKAIKDYKLDGIVIGGATPRGQRSTHAMQDRQLNTALLFNNLSSLPETRYETN